MSTMRPHTYHPTLPQAPAPHLPHAISTPAPHLLHTSSTPPPHHLHTSSTPSPHVLHICSTSPSTFTCMHKWVHVTFVHGFGPFVHICSTCAPHVLHICSTSAPHLLHTCSTSAPHLLHICSTPAPRPCGCQKHPPRALCGVCAYAQPSLVGYLAHGQATPRLHARHRTSAPRPATTTTLPKPHARPPHACCSCPQCTRRLCNAVRQALGWLEGWCVVAARPDLIRLWQRPGRNRRPFFCVCVCFTACLPGRCCNHKGGESWAGRVAATPAQPRASGMRGRGEGRSGRDQARGDWGGTCLVGGQALRHLRVLARACCDACNRGRDRAWPPTTAEYSSAPLPRQRLCRTAGSAGQGH